MFLAIPLRGRRAVSPGDDSSLEATSTALQDDGASNDGARPEAASGGELAQCHSYASLGPVLYLPE